MDPTELAKALDELGQRIGPYGEAAWAILVRQMVIEGATGAMFYLLLIVLTVVASIVALKIGQRIRRDQLAMWELRVGDDNYYRSQKPKMESYWFAFGIWSAFAGMFLVVFAWALTQDLIKVFNPEYAALTQLLYLIKP